MGSVNNWLGFSLSPQEQSQNSSSGRQGFNSDDISAVGDCYDLTSHSSVPSLNLPASFGILEAFNRSSNTTNQSQDWNMNEMSMDNEHHHQYMGNTTANTNTSHLTNLTCTTSHNLDQNEAPKLENFLGGHSFSDQYNNMYSNCSLPPRGEPMPQLESNTSGGGNSNFGLSMIKNWLRNQPTPTSIPENKNGDGGGTGSGGGALSLSMSTESQTDTPFPVMVVGGGGGESSVSSGKENAIKLDAQTGALETVPRKSIDTFGQRTSIYRGVTRHRWTGRYEAHLWDNSCRREGQTRKGRQVYLGGYDKEDKAARAYDLAALKYWGTTTTTNFPMSNYDKEIEEMKNMTRQEFVASLRRKSSGFSRGASIYRGVTRHHQHGRWQARIGRVAGNKDLYLGTFSTQEEAAEAYDIAAIKFRGLSAVTNFDMNRYDVKSILESSTLPIGGAAKRLKDAENSQLTIMDATRTVVEETLTHGNTPYGWPSHIAFQQALPLHHYPSSYATQQQRGLWFKQEQDVDSATTFQDQIGNNYNTHNFFQTPSSYVHNMIGLDTSSMEHSSGSNSNLYASTGVDSTGGYVSGNGNYVLPMATVIHQDGNIDGESGYGYENVFGSSDSYNGRSMYYVSQQNGGVVKASSIYDQSSACNNWVPTAVPALAARESAVVACQVSAQPFTVWNDA